MKFLITGDLHSKKGLYWAVLSFLVFSFLFWLSGFLNFYFKYGFDYNSLFKYYFTDPEFPERISLQQLSEDFHINSFLYSFFYLMLSSLLAMTEVRYRLKVSIIILSALLCIAYLLSDFVILFSESLVIYSKLYTFFGFQVISGLMILMVLNHLIRGKTPGKRISLQKIIIYVSTLLLSLFLVSTALIYFSKFGLSVSGIKEYFLGNPEKFKRAKTVSGVMKSFYPHLLTMALFSFTLTHFAGFSANRRKIIVIIGVLLTITFFMENLSSILILFNGDFSYLKAVTFYLGVTLSIFLILSVFSLKKDS
ncbi:MAG: hypothetical protein N2Z81_06645 [Hydrogenothermaceae bacterium]|nr:hypothetical protein [Hydrogenothermaceae bacterium]